MNWKFTDGFGLIGCGKVGKALIGGFIKNGKISPNLISVYSPLAEDKEWAASNSCRVLMNNNEVVSSNKLIFLVVRPEVVSNVLLEIAAKLGDDKLIISVAAGVNIHSIESCLSENAKVARIMLNLQIQSCKGTCAVAVGKKCTIETRDTLVQLMSTLGYCTELPESEFNAFTALAGSGPAFVYGVIESLAEGATLQGIPRKKAIEIAAHMVYGSAFHALENMDTCHPCQLREAVCTPGGSSIRGVYELEKAGYRAAFISAINAAVEHNKVLGRNNIN